MYKRQFLNIPGRHNIFQLHPVDLDAPVVGGFVQDRPHLSVDVVPAGQGLVQLQIADNITKGGSGQVFNGGHGVLHPIGVQFGICDLKINYGIDLHSHVVLSLIHILLLGRQNGGGCPHGHSQGEQQR